MIFSDKSNRKEDVVGRPRTVARLAAVQAIYQMVMTGDCPEKIVQEFILFRLPMLEEYLKLGVPDKKLFEILARGTAKKIDWLDELIASSLFEEASADRLENTLQAILRVGVFELKGSLKTPTAVVISEYVDVTHAFYEGKTAGLVNGILDKLAQNANVVDSD